MLKTYLAIAVVAMALPASTAFADESRAIKADAEKMVKKGVAFLKSSGKDKAIAEMTAPSKTFVDRDL